MTACSDVGFCTPRLWLEAAMPRLYGAARPDVLFVPHRHAHVEIAIETLAAAGIPAAGCSMGDRDLDIPALQRIIDELSPKLVINHALAVDPEPWEAAAKAFPRVRFLATAHCGQSNMLLYPGFTRKHMQFLATTGRRNCWYGDVDERQVWRSLATDGSRSKMVHVPNPLRVIQSRPRGNLQPPWTVSLVGWARVLKNFPAQILGFALAARQADLKLILCLSDTVEHPVMNDLMVLAAFSGVDAVVADWQEDWHKFARFVAHDVDLGLQVSFTESFNYTAIEHMLVGKPVVGSPAIRYLPPTWCANPDDPADMARVLLEHIEDYDARSREAVQVARDVAARNNQAFVSTVRSLLA